MSTIPAKDGTMIVPVHDSAKKSAHLIRGAKEIYYPGAPYGLRDPSGSGDADLLAFLRSAATPVA